MKLSIDSCIRLSNEVSTFTSTGASNSLDISIEVTLSSSLYYILEIAIKGFGME